MKDNIERNGWATFIDEFSKRNTSRPTWLQVLGEGGAQSEEHGLPLTGISLEEKDGSLPRVQIMLGGHDAMGMSHLTHVVSELDRVMPQVGIDGRDESIEFVDKNGEASLLIFDHRARQGAFLQIGAGRESSEQSGVMLSQVMTQPQLPESVSPTKCFVACA